VLGQAPAERAAVADVVQRLRAGDRMAGVYIVRKGRAAEGFAVDREAFMKAIGARR